jgi:hypothetical protein
VELAGEGEGLGGHDVGLDRLLGPGLRGRIADHGRQEDDGVDVPERIHDGLDVRKSPRRRRALRPSRPRASAAVDEAVQDADLAAGLEELADEDAAEVAGASDDQDVPVGGGPGGGWLGGDGGDLLPDLLEAEAADDAVLGVDDGANLEVPHLHVVGDPGQEIPVGDPALGDPERIEGGSGVNRRRSRPRGYRRSR